MKKNSLKKQTKMISKKGGAKSWVLFAVILIGLFALALLWQQKRSSGPLPPETEVVKPGKPFAAEELSEKEKNLRDQEGLKNAFEGGSAESCDTLFDEALKNQCRDQINFTRFVSGGDPARCDALSDAALQQRCRDQITFQAALDELNEGRCLTIADTALQQSCLDKIRATLGGHAKTLADCDLITSETLKNDCQNQFRYKSSLDSLNAAGCTDITDPGVKNRCQAAVAQNLKVMNQAKSLDSPVAAISQEKVATACDSLGEAGDACRDEANFNLALEKKDLSYCNKIVDAQRKSTCLQTQDSNLNRFHLTQAIAKGDATLCQKITNPSLQSTCLSYLQQQK